MVWVNNINQLEYWKPSGAPGGCYHEMIFSPVDLMLQAWWFGQVPDNDYTLLIETYTTDGLTFLEDVTSHFAWYFFPVNINNNIRDYCNMWLNTLPNSMCANKCFILKVTITSTVTQQVKFSKFTQAYEIDPTICCVPVTGITVEQDNQEIGAGCSIAEDAPVVAPNHCDRNWLFFRAEYPCVDNSTGDYYGYPNVSQVYSSNSASYRRFVRVCWIDAILRQNPREITRIVAYNCTVQKISHTDKWQLQGRVLFPEWKKREIEMMFTSPGISIDGYGSFHAWSGGTVMERAVKSIQAFRLNAVLEECEKRQIFGCNDLQNCNPQSLFLGLRVAPPTGRFFNDARTIIADDYDGLLIYLRQVNGVTSVSEVVPTPDQIACTFYKILKIEGGGPDMPTMIYSDYPIPTNRIYAKTLETDDATGEPKYNDLCNGRVDLFYNVPAPDLGTIVLDEIAVPAPDLGTVVVEDMNSSNIIITGNGGWGLSIDSEGAALGNLVSISISVLNPAYTAAPPTTFVMEHIATLSDIGRPASTIIIDDSVWPMLPAGRAIQINPDGKVYWSGQSISEDGSGAVIEFYNVQYDKS